MFWSDVNMNFFLYAIMLCMRVLNLQHIAILPTDNSSTKRVKVYPKDCIVPSYFDDECKDLSAFSVLFFTIFTLKLHTIKERITS